LRGFCVAAAAAVGSYFDDGDGSHRSSSGGWG